MRKCLARSTFSLKQISLRYQFPEPPCVYVNFVGSQGRLACCHASLSTMSDTSIAMVWFELAARANNPNHVPKQTFSPGSSNYHAWAVRLRGFVMCPSS